MASCYRFLIPVARCLLNSGVTYREFQELAKNAFVRVALVEYGLRGRSTNSSRVSAMTGITRRDVARIREASDEGYYDARKMQSPSADVILRWSSEREFLDDSGSPLALRLSGDVVSFEALVRSTVKDIPVGAIRKELERLGAIEPVGEEHIRLIRPYLIPNTADERLISALSYSLRALAETVAYNSSSTDPQFIPRIERFIESRDLTPAEVGELRQEIALRLSELTRELGDLLTSGTPPADHESRRIGVGFYYSE